MNSTHQHPNEEAIDQVLAALRETPVPHNMERRILNVLEARQSTFSNSVPPSEATQSRSRGAAFRYLRWAPLACCVSLAIVVVSARIMRHAAPESPTNSPSTTTHAPSQPTTITAAAQAVPVPPTPGPLNHSLPHPTPPNPIEVDESDGTQAVSHPAPPIPLTDQERILLRFSRRGRSDDLAEISNDRKAAKEQQEAADFQAFFEPIIVPGESE